MTNTYRSGDWYAICDVCGFKYHASKLRIRWDGMRVCEKDWEPRQPQDLIRGVPDHMQVPWSRPQPTESFVSRSTLQGISAVPGYAVPGYSIPGLVSTGLTFTPY